MPHPNEIEYEYGGHVYIWVRPADGKTWYDITHNSHERLDYSWRRAKLSGHCFEEEHRGTGIDGRRIWLIDNHFGYDLDKFEFGEILEPPMQRVLAPV